MDQLPHGLGPEAGQPQPGGEQHAEDMAAQFARRTQTSGTPIAMEMRPADEATTALDELGRKRQQQAAAAELSRTAQIEAALNPAALDEENGHIGLRPEASQDQQPPADPETQHERKAS